MDNGYLIAFVVVAALSIVILRYRNRDTLQRDERNDRFQRPREDPGPDREDTRTAHTHMDFGAWETASLEPAPTVGQDTSPEARRQP